MSLRSVKNVGLFENEAINISKIHTVNRYDSIREFENKTVAHYNGTLPTYELIYFVSGKGITHFGDRTIQDIKGTIRYLPKGAENVKYYVENIEPGMCIDVYFDTAEPMPDYAVGLKNMNEAAPLFEKILNTWISRKNGYYTEAMSLFYDIINKIKKNNYKYFANSKGKKIEPSYNYMLEHFSDRNFNFKAMCGKSGLSYDYFKELFINYYGMSPVKYVTALRIEHAKELLITGHYSVTELAEMCGFDNVYYFSAVFKKHVGLSPKNYIKLYLIL